MNTRPRFWKRPLFYLVLPFALYLLFTVIVGGAYLLAVVGGHYMDDHQVYSQSPAEARRAGVFLDTIIVQPRVLRYGDYEVTFDNCWAERQRERHRPNWHSRRVETKLSQAALYLNFRVSCKGKPLDKTSDPPYIHWNNHQAYPLAHHTTMARTCRIGAAGNLMVVQPYEIWVSELNNDPLAQRALVYPAKVRNRQKNAKKPTGG